MADNNTTGTTKTASLKTIEELQKENNVSDAVFEGVKALKGWKNGRQVLPDEFLKACKEFETAPIDGHRAKKGAKG